MNNNKEVNRVFVEDVNIIVDAVMKEFEKYVKKQNDKKIIIHSPGRGGGKAHLRNEIIKRNNKPHK